LIWGVIENSYCNNTRCPKSITCCPKIGALGQILGGGRSYGLFVFYFGKGIEIEKSVLVPKFQVFYKDDILDFY